MTLDKSKQGKEKKRDTRNLELNEENLKMLLFNVIDDVAHDLGVNFPTTDEEIEKIKKEVDMPDRIPRRHEVQGTENGNESSEGDEPDQSNK